MISDCVAVMFAAVITFVTLVSYIPITIYLTGHLLDDRSLVHLYQNMVDLLDVVPSKLSGGLLRGTVKLIYGTNATRIGW